MERPRRRALRPAFDRLDGRCLLSGLMPSRVSPAYGLGSIQFGSAGIKGDGTGQTIAIVDAYHDPYLASDLHAFDQACHLPDPTLTEVNLAGSRTDDGWAGETALDVEWAHAMAPGAQIVVVEARSDSTTDLLAAVDAARGIASVSVVSMSWGAGEFSGETRLDSRFTTPAGHKGITFISASGDEGTRGGAEWPSSSPNVLSVAGTTLRVGAGGSYQGESIWTGSSGGTSRYEAEPAYQRSLQTSGRRTTPDVAFDGDPNTGVSVYETDPSSGRGSWQVVGGTSLGAPAWAALVAIADQGRATAGLGSLDGAAQTLPTLYALPASDFHKLATTRAGLGTPNGAALVTGLAFGTTATPKAVTQTAVGGGKGTERSIKQVRSVHFTRLIRSVPFTAPISAPDPFSASRSRSAPDPFSALTPFPP